MNLPAQVALGAVLAAVVASVAAATRLLTWPGAVAAALVGAAVFGFGGPVMGLILIAFFVSSSALTRWHATVKTEGTKAPGKGGARDLTQVLANGAVPASVAIAFGLSGNDHLLAAFTGAVAAATADTWATEIGLLSRVPPRLVTTGVPARPGTSGAVTALGSAAAAAGGIFIGAVAALLVIGRGAMLEGAVDLTGVRLLLIGPAAGLAGAAADSLLGATVQNVRRCPRCETETERARHSCGAITRSVRGWPWLTGDGVNLLAGLVGALLGLAIDVLVFG